MTIWLDYFSIFGHLQQWKFAPKISKFYQSGWKNCHTQNKPFVCQWFVNFFTKEAKFLQIWTHWSPNTFWQQGSIRVSTGEVTDKVNVINQLSKLVRDNIRFKRWQKGGGQVVSVLVVHSNNPSSNPAKVYSLIVWKNQNKQKDKNGPFEKDDRFELRLDWCVFNLLCISYAWHHHKHSALK